jgi:hypothetical protein
MREYLLPTTFLLSPFLILSTGYIWTGQQIGLMMVFLLLLAAMIENRWVQLFIVYVVVYQTWLFIDAIVNPSLFRAALSSGYTQVLFMFAGAMIFHATSKSKVSVGIFYNIICIAALIQAGIAILQVTLIDLVPITLSLIATAKSQALNIPVGTLGNQNYLAAFLAFSTVFFLRRIWIFGLIPVCVALFISHTTSAVVPAVIGIGLFCILRYQLKLKLIAGVVLLCALMALMYGLYDASIFVNDRFEIWGSALNQVLNNNIIFGLGPGALWAGNYPLHSEWVTLVHQFGLIGLILAGGYLVTVSRKNIYLFSSFVIIVINMAGNAALHIPPTAFLACLVAGLMERDNG